MTAPTQPEPTPDERFALVAVDRDKLIAELTAEPAKRKRWRVVRQYNDQFEFEVCAHRFEWVADVCAYRLAARHRHEIGVFYTVRRGSSR